MAEKTTIKPIGLNILIKPVESEKTSRMGVVLVEKDPERPQKGEVIALGTGAIMPNGQMYQFPVKEGDMVMFKKYGGTEVELDGEKFMIMTDQDLLGVLQ
jgi:chaperonin GroES